MQYKNYLCRKRARFDGISGQVNIPYGTALICQDGFLMHQNKPLCGITSQNAYDFFSQNDDGMGRERGDLVGRILSRLQKRDSGYQARWNKVWEDARCQSTSARSMKIIGFGTLTSTMGRLRICAISPV